MSDLARWYPGDAGAFAALDVLGMISLLVALAWAVARLTARHRPALRCTLWQAALVGVLLTPALAVVGNRLPWRVALLPGEPTPTARAEPPAARTPLPAPDGRPGESPSPPAGRPPLDLRSGPAGAPSVGAGRPTPAPRPAGATMPTPALHPGTEPTAAAAVTTSTVSGDVIRAATTVALAVWALGSLYLAARLAHGWWRIRRLWRRLRPLDGPGWAAERAAVGRRLAVRPPEVCRSPDVRGPLVAGLFRPRVVLPDALLGRAARQWRAAVLLHECAHVARGDPWVRLLQRLAAVLFWPHPLVHLLNGRLDQAREEVCDNHVLAHLDAPAYAETLLAVAQLCYSGTRLQGHLTMMPTRYPLERRVADLLEDRRDVATRLPVPHRLALGLALLAVLGAAASVGLRGATAQAAAQPQAAAADPAKPAPAAAVTQAGQVRTVDGKPAAGAVVWAAKLDYGPLDHRATVADADGKYALTLDAGEWFFWARQGTQGIGGPPHSVRRKLAAGKNPRPLDLRLEERGTFRGRLLAAESGEPIAGGRLFLDGGLALTTGPDGRFTLGGLARANHEGFVVAPGRMRLRVLFDTTASADTELEVPVPRAGKIVGRVTDTEGRPIPGAYVGRHTSGTFFSINGLFQACDADGRFAYDDAVPADQPTRLTAGAPGYVEAELNGLSPAPDGKPLEFQFRLQAKPADRAEIPGPDGEKRRVITGVVRGPDGKPVAEVVVRWGYQPSTDAIETRTDAAGRFRLIVPDRAGLVSVLPRAFAPQFPRAEAGGDQELAVTVEAGHTARGRVVDEAGKPIPGVQVVAVIGSPQQGIANPFWLSEAAGHTDADGRFEVKGVPAGARFDFLKAGMTDLRNQDLVLDGGENTVAATLSYGGAVFGRVIGPDGKPLRNFRVLVNAPREQRPGDQSGGYFAGYCGIGVRFTSPDGTFVLTGVGAGSVLRISALAEGYSEAVVDRVTAIPLNRLATATPVTLKAGPPAALRVVVTARGKPVADARVTLVNGDLALDQGFAWGYHNASWEDMTRGRTAADGAAAFPALRFGEATVLVEAAGYARRRAGWRDGRKAVTFDLTPEAAVAGEVLDAAGNPVKGFYVNLFGGSNDQISGFFGTATPGRFRIGELPAGTWAITVRAADGSTVLYEGSVNVEPGETRDVKVRAK